MRKIATHKFFDFYIKKAWLSESFLLRYLFWVIGGQLIENQLLLRQIYKERLIISYKPGRSLKDILVKAKLWKIKAILKHVGGKREVWFLFIMRYVAIYRAIIFSFIARQLGKKNCHVPYGPPYKTLKWFTQTDKSNNIAHTLRSN